MGCKERLNYVPLELKTKGYVIETKEGKKGRTYHEKPLINGKVQVILDDGTKLLCSEESLTVKGFID